MFFMNCTYSPSFTGRYRESINPIRDRNTDPSNTITDHDREEPGIMPITNHDKYWFQTEIHSIFISVYYKERKPVALLTNLSNLGK